MTRSNLEAWVVRLNPGRQADLRLFCFPYSGGGASIFNSWIQHLPAEVDICSIELPGRESRIKEPPFTQLSLLTQELAAALDPYFDVPFLFFGHCLGALMSFELARYLRKWYSLSPLHLFLSAHGAPQNIDHRSPIRNLPDQEFIEEIRKLRGTPEQILQNESLMRLLLPALRADIALTETYTYDDTEAPLKCSASVFGGLEDAVVSYEDIITWKRQIAGAWSVHMFPGDHFFLHQSRLPLLQSISETISSLLQTLE